MARWGRFEHDLVARPVRMQLDASIEHFDDVMVLHGKWQDRLFRQVPEKQPESLKVNIKMR